MSRTLPTILLGLAWLPFLGPLPSAQAKDTQAQPPAQHLEGVRWGDPGHREFFEFQRWMARLVQDGRGAQDLPKAFDTEETWKRLSKEERAERILQGEAFVRMLKEGNSDRETLVKLLGSHVNLDSRISGVSQVSQQIRAPDEFKRFVEGSQLLAMEVAFQPAKGPEGKRIGLTGPGAAGGAAAGPGPKAQGPASSPSARPLPGPEAAVAAPSAGAVSGGPGRADGTGGFAVLAFAAVGLTVALGIGLAARRLSYQALGGAGAAPEAPAGASSAFSGEGPAPSMFRPTPGPAAQAPAGSGPAPSVPRPPIGPVEPPGVAVRAPFAPAAPEPPASSLSGPPAAPRPSLEGVRPAAWWAITKEEQRLLNLWAQSPEKAAGQASFEEWLDLNRNLAAGVNLKFLKDKLHREPS
ncbi:MAG: hypothetical protein HY748_09860 [Elusimicrobia bacterium]|nr:hypothetical protein [Elusimicrobiota bacterium]